MSPDEFRKALDTLDEHAWNTIGRTFCFPELGSAPGLLTELIRRAREHLAAQASDDEVEAAVNAMLRSESWSCFFSREDCTSIARAALTAAKIKTAEAVAAEREACAQIAATAFGGPAHTYASENADVYRAQDDACVRIAAAIRARGSSS